VEAPTSPAAFSPAASPVKAAPVEPRNVVEIAAAEMKVAAPPTGAVLAKKSREDFIFLKSIGEGSYSTVRRAWGFAFYFYFIY
jgi:hypothetical protein